jgi:hypothetical protein
MEAYCESVATTRVVSCVSSGHCSCVYHGLGSPSHLLALPCSIGRCISAPSVICRGDHSDRERGPLSSTHRSSRCFAKCFKPRNRNRMTKVCMSEAIILT